MFIIISFNASGKTFLYRVLSNLQMFLVLNGNFDLYFILFILFYLFIFVGEGVRNAAINKLSIIKAVLLRHHLGNTKNNLNQNCNFLYSLNIFSAYT